jgi:serine/threonine protein kinase
VQVGEALLHAHQLGVYHRDLKTENVMFNESGVLKLTDFAPGGPANPALSEETDIHGFGLLLYELAGGRPPVELSPSAIENFRADLPAEFKHILGRSLQRDRPDCYRQLESLVQDLRWVTGAAAATQRIQDVPAVKAPAAVPRLGDGRLLAGRFRIIRFLARGGMGEVYEAEDLELGEHVALKTIRPDIAGGDQPLARFKREIQLARKVTHPNVCRIFDVFHHVDRWPTGYAAPAR